jgi:predicted Zn-dependent peptidase
MPQLERSFGSWKPVATVKGTKDFAVIPANPSPRIILIDRPNSPQSLILAGELLPGKGKDELVPLIAANDVLGGSSSSRIFQDLRETKGWAYGAQSFINRVYDTSPYLVYAPVQTDKTGASITALQANIRDFVTTKGVTPAELQRTVASSIRELPGAYETGDDVLGGMQRNDLYQRPDDYYAHLADRYRALSAAQLDQVARAAIDPAKFIWVVVGDAAKVQPQLASLGLPVEVQKAPPPAPKQ